MHLKFEVSLDDGQTWVFMPIVPNNALAVAPDHFFNLRYRIRTETDGDITIAIPTKTASNPEGLFAWSDWNKVSVTPEEVLKSSSKSVLSIPKARSGGEYEFQLQQEEAFALIEDLPCAIKASLKSKGNLTEEVMYQMVLQQPVTLPTIALFCSDKLVYLQNDTVRFQFKLGYTGSQEELKRFVVQLRVGKRNVPYSLGADGSEIMEAVYTANQQARFTCVLELKDPLKGVVASEDFYIDVIDGSPNASYLYPFLLKDPTIQDANQRDAPANNDNQGKDWEVMGLFTRPDEPNHLYGLLRKGQEGRLYQSLDGSTWKRFSLGGEYPQIAGASLESPYCLIQDGYLYQLGGSRYQPLPSSDFIKLPLSAAHDAVVIQKSLSRDDEPFEICGHALFVYDQQIYLVGGFNDSGTSNVIYRCDPNSGAITAIATMTFEGKPYRICNHQVRVVGKKLYLFGGSAKGFDAGYKNIQGALFEFPIGSLGNSVVQLDKVPHGLKSSPEQWMTGTGLFQMREGIAFLAGSRNQGAPNETFIKEFQAVVLKNNGFEGIETKIRLPGAEYFQLQGDYFMGAAWLAYGSEAMMDNDPLQNKIIKLYVG